MLAHAKLGLLIDGDTEGDREDSREHNQDVIQTCLLRNESASIHTSQNDETSDQREDHRHDVQRGLRGISRDRRMLRGKLFVVSVSHFRQCKIDSKE